LNVVFTSNRLVRQPDLFKKLMKFGVVCGLHMFVHRLVWKLLLLNYG